MLGYNCQNKKRFSSRQKVDSELAVTTSFGSLYRICGAATTKVRLPTVNSLTGGTTRRLVLVEQNGRRRGKSSMQISGPR